MENMLRSCSNQQMAAKESRYRKPAETCKSIFQLYSLGRCYSLTAGYKLPIQLALCLVSVSAYGLDCTHSLNALSVLNNKCTWCLNLPLLIAYPAEVPASGIAKCPQHIRGELNHANKVHHNTTLYTIRGGVSLIPLWAQTYFIFLSWNTWLFWTRTQGNLLIQCFHQNWILWSCVNQFLNGIVATSPNVVYTPGISRAVNQYFDFYICFFHCSALLAAFITLRVVRHESFES